MKGVEGGREMDRREFIRRSAGAAAVGVGLAGMRASWAGEGAPAQGADRPAVDQFKGVRGFNYQPSYEATGYAIWRYFKPERIDIELGRGKKYFPKMNAIRVWLSFDAFAADPAGFSENFESFLKIADKYGLKAAPTLFNNWHSVPDFGGISDDMIRYWFTGYGKRGTAANYVFRPYLETIVGGHARDTRILLWDLCNDPLTAGDAQLTLEWLKHSYQICMALGPVQPIGVSGAASVEQMELLNPVSEVLLIQPYHAEKCPLDDLCAFAVKRGKPLLATECCWGALDDVERAKIITSDLGALSKHGLGFLAHVLHESLVADCHRSQYGPVSSAGYMAFINMDGTLRKYHEVYNNF